MIGGSGFVPDFENIKVPMLNCISFASQMMHTRGSARAYARTGSTQKWLYTHRGGEWTTYYSTEANALMLKFFDYFLKGIHNGMPEHPKVRLEIREFGDRVKEVRSEAQWPPENIQWRQYFLNSRDQSLSPAAVTQDSSCSFDLRNGSVSFSMFFDRDTEIVGPLKLTLFIELQGCQDANIFAGVQKFHLGKEVNFDGTYGFPNDIVTKTALRVALRSLNQSLSQPASPEYDFNELKPLQAGEVAELVFQFEPSATFFRKGDELRLVLQGKYFINSLKINQPFTYQGNRNGSCKVHTTAAYGSALLLPVIEK